MIEEKGRPWAVIHYFEQEKERYDAKHKTRTKHTFGYTCTHLHYHRGQELEVLRLKSDRQNGQTSEKIRWPVISADRKPAEMFVCSLWPSRKSRPGGNRKNRIHTFGCQYKLDPGIMTFTEHALKHSFTLEFLTNGRLFFRRPWCIGHERSKSGNIIGLFVTARMGFEIAWKVKVWNQRKTDTGFQRLKAFKNP